MFLRATQDTARGKKALEEDELPPKSQLRAHPFSFTLVQDDT